MSIVVFLGPTLSRAEATRVLDAELLPPASHGDVYRATLQHPSAIGIVDGTFRNAPSIWHKEILWALHQTIPVFGSSSMGALRAAELDQFGMIGVGAIYNDFRNGVLEDDDEVAVAHGGSEDNFVAQSEALVNIRATLRAAVDQNVITPGTDAILIKLIKQEFFPDRSYQTLLKIGARAKLPEAELGALREWLPEGKRDQKKEDALAMLRDMAQVVQGGLRHTPNFVFQHTRFFERARRSASSAPVQMQSDADRITLEDILSEVKLYPHLYQDLRTAAITRGLSAREAQRSELHFDSQQLQDAADAFRRERNLRSIEETERWLRDNELTMGQFKALIREQVAVATVSHAFSDECQVHIRSELRARGLFAQIIKRTHAKRSLLEANGLLDTDTSPSDVTTDELIAWFYRDRLDMEPPATIAECASALDFEDENTFLATLRREYWYEQLAGQHAASASFSTRAEGRGPLAPGAY